MPFLAQKPVAISNKDLLSWMFDQPDYDLDIPINIIHPGPNSKTAVAFELVKLKAR